LHIVDATCPLVHEIHHEVRAMEEEGRQIYIIGDKGHDEVMGIMSQVEKPILISTPEEARQLRKKKRGGVVSQSTQMVENAQEIISILMMKVKDLRIVNTICHPTRQNQSELKELALSNDVMIVVGSFTSANTKRLTKIAQELNPHSYQVENAADIQPEWLSNASSVGVHAGASTPDDAIQEVVDYLHNYSSEEKLTEEA
jgi:4-hydroxy-3-methylbut-2-enyl diphosphate reductase